MSYYQIWLAGLERLMLERGLVACDEIEAGKPLHPAKTGRENADAPTASRGCSTGADRPSASRRPGPFRGRRPGAARRQSIRRRHTRLPRYVRGHVGTVELRARRATYFPTATRRGAGEEPQWLYTVTFDGRELWGDDADPHAEVSVDAWESYLERA